MNNSILEKIKEQITNNKTILFINPSNNNNITSEIKLFSETINKKDDIKYLSSLKNNNSNIEINILFNLKDLEIATLISNNLFLDDDFFISVIFVRILLTLNAISFLSKKYDETYLKENNIPKRENINLEQLNNLLDKKDLLNIISLIEQTNIEENEKEYINNFITNLHLLIKQYENSFYSNFIKKTHKLIKNFLLTQNTIFYNKNNKNLINLLEENKEHTIILETNILKQEALSQITIAYILNLITIFYNREEKVKKELHIFINDKKDIIKYKEIKDYLEKLSHYSNISIFYN